MGIAECYEQKMKKSLSALQEGFNTLRTERATAHLLDQITVDYYQQPTALSQVATVSVPEARLIIIQPWDKTLLADIERAILKSKLSLNPSNDGKVIRLVIPPLTQERRKELVRQARALAEQARVAIRNIRREGIEEAKRGHKEGLLSEDALKAAEEAFQKATDASVADVARYLAEKEKDIL
ncbi:ribosome recycling factor, partial [Treponema pallidum]